MFCELREKSRKTMGRSFGDHFHLFLSAAWISFFLVLILIISINTDRERASR